MRALQAIGANDLSPEVSPTMRPHRSGSIYGRQAPASLPTEATLLAGLFDRLPVVAGINLAVTAISGVVFWPVIAGPVIVGRTTPASGRTRSWSSSNSCFSGPCSFSPRS